MTQESLLHVQKTDTFEVDNTLKTVSVIIPFSKPGTVGNAIESVLSQNYPEEFLEIIIVGKGSKQLQEKWPRIIAVDKGPIFRPGKARNYGAEKAEGEILLFLDDDCEAQEGWIRENIDELRNEDIGAISGMIVGKSASFFARCVDFSSFGLCQLNYRREGRQWSATFGIRKDIFDKVDGFDETLKIHEDIDLCFRLNRMGLKSVYSPAIKVTHNHGRTTFLKFLSYQYNVGRRSSLEVESKYEDLSFRNWILKKAQNPLIYLFSIVPFAVAGTLLTIKTNVRQHKDILLLAPFIFLGKVIRLAGMFQSVLENSLSKSWRITGAINTTVKVAQYTLFKRWFKTPRVLTLFVTSKCNAKCQHCFYWRNLNQDQDLTLEEIARLSQSLGKVDKLLISGGEPFLRHDLPEICSLFFQNNQLSMVSIPTNGLRPALIHDQLLRILDQAKGKSVRVALSLDGPKEVHDEVRGVPGSFTKVVETHKLIHSLQNRFSNLSIGLCSCVTNQNYTSLFRLYEALPDIFPTVDHPSLILLRGNPKNNDIRLPSIGELQSLYRYKKSTSSSRQPLLWRFADWITFRIGLEAIMRERQVVPCEAGRILGVVEDNGDVRQCELLPAIGNLRDENFMKIWGSQEAIDARKRIVEKKCWCTHECNVFESLLANPINGLKLLLQVVLIRKGTKVKYLSGDNH